jgi:hypothetical protein
MEKEERKGERAKETEQRRPRGKKQIGWKKAEEGERREEDQGIYQEQQSTAK